MLEWHVYAAGRLLAVVQFEHGIVKELRLDLSRDGFVVCRVAELQGVAGGKEECADGENEANSESQSWYVYSRHLCPPTKTAFRSLSLWIRVYQEAQASHSPMSLAFQPSICLIQSPQLRMHARHGVGQRSMMIPKSNEGESEHVRMARLRCRAPLGRGAV